MNQPSVITLDPQRPREADHIHVFLKDCRIMLSVGYHPAERLKPQPVIVSIEAEALLPHHYQDTNENSLDRVIDYERFYNFLIKELPHLGHIPLLETVAEQIIMFCFEDRRIHMVCVKLEKPQVLDGKARAGIEVRRARPQERA
jgi:dihydroneopterin aldolase